jgi:hypothetical protein
MATAEKSDVNRMASTFILVPDKLKFSPIVCPPSVSLIAGLRLKLAFSKVRTGSERSSAKLLVQPGL